jgi:hypothetical protein
MLRKSVKLGLPEDEIYYGVIDPHPEEPEEVETSLFEFEEIEPSPGRSSSGFRSPGSLPCSAFTEHN